MPFFPDFSKHTVTPEVAAHERKQLKWFLVLGLLLLIGTAAVDFILSSHGKVDIKPGHNPLINPTATPMLFLTPSPIIASPTILSPTKSASTPAKVTFCTQEAKLCPDGHTYVSRTGPNCAFAACPPTQN